MSRSIFLKSLLVLTLLFVQMGGLTHGIGHALAQQSQDQSLPHDNHCELCATYAQIGSAIGSHAIQFDFASRLEVTLATHSASCRSIAFAAFAARGPPLSV